MVDPVAAGSVPVSPAPQIAPVAAAPVIPTPVAVGGAIPQPAGAPQIEPTGVAAYGVPGEAAPAAPVDYRMALPDDLKGSPALQTIADVPSLARQFVDLQQHMGNSLRIPSDNAGPEAMVEFRNKIKERQVGLMDIPDGTDPDNMNRVYDMMGRPEDATKYTRPQFEEGTVSLAEGSDQAFAETAHRIGLNDVQFNELYALNVSLQAKQVKDQETNIDADMQNLNNEWGYTFDSRMDAIAQTLETFGFPEEAVKAAQERKLGHGFATAMYNMVKSLGGEGEVILQGKGEGSQAMSPDEANRQIQEIQARPEYNNHDLTVRQPWINKVQELMKYAVPGALSGQAAIDNMRRG